MNRIYVWDLIDYTTGARVPRIIIATINEAREYMIALGRTRLYSGHALEMVSRGRWSI